MDETIALRLAALEKLNVLDTPEEQDFDDIVFLANQICRTPVSLVSLVTDNRQWFKARLGFPRCETPLEQSVCKFAMLEDDVFIITDLSKDARTRNNTLVTLDPHIRFYAGAPLKNHKGVPIGSLCVIDTVPRPEGLTGDQKDGLRALARQVMKLLNERRLYLLLGATKDAEHAITTMELKDERRMAGMREQFVAILGHDLRNPIGAIKAGTDILLSNPDGGHAEKMLPMIQRATLRMEELVANMLDLARAKIGGGMDMVSNSDAPLQPVLEQVVSELHEANPARTINTHYNISTPVICDRSRISQLFSNLLGNALKHGSSDAPIFVNAETSGGIFTLSVANAGKPIPPDLINDVFSAYSYGVDNGRSGLGLGLYISSEIVRAHHGTLNVTSDERETKFTVRIPLGLQLEKIAV